MDNFYYKVLIESRYDLDELKVVALQLESAAD